MLDVLFWTSAMKIIWLMKIIRQTRILAHKKQQPNTWRAISMSIKSSKMRSLSSLSSSYAQTNLWTVWLRLRRKCFTKFSKLPALSRNIWCATSIAWPGCSSSCSIRILCPSNHLRHLSQLHAVSRSQSCRGLAVRSVSFCIKFFVARSGQISFTVRVAAITKSRFHCFLSRPGANWVKCIKWFLNTCFHLLARLQPANSNHR